VTGAAQGLRPRRLAANAISTHSLEVNHCDPADETSASCPAFGHRQDDASRLCHWTRHRQV